MRYSIFLLMSVLWFPGFAKAAELEPLESNSIKIEEIKIQSSNIERMERNKYKLTANFDTKYYVMDAAKRAVMEATEYCKSQNKNIDVDYTQGGKNSASLETMILFFCTDLPQE